MSSVSRSIPIQRYIAIDSHKHYVMVGGMNQQREWTLRPRKVSMARFREWASINLKSDDAVILETTCQCLGYSRCGRPSRCSDSRRQCIQGAPDC